MGVVLLKRTLTPSQMPNYERTSNKPIARGKQHFNLARDV